MHTNFKKFIALAASASIVAVAAVPTAEAANFSDTAKTKYDVPAKALVDRHIMTSYKNGTFRPAEKLKRKHLVLFTGKYLESEHYEVPIEYLSVERFEDLMLPSDYNEELFNYGMIVRDLGVMTDTYLKPNAELTKDDMALALVCAYAIVHDFDIMNYVATQNFKRTITDTKAAKKQTQAAIDVLDYYGIVKNKYFPKGIASRGEYAYILHSLMQIKPDANYIKAVGVIDAKTIRVVLPDYSTKVVKLNTTLKADVPTTISFKLDGKTYKSTVTYTKQKDVLKTTAITDKKAKIILTDGSVYDYEDKFGFWTNSDIFYGEKFGGQYFNFQIRLNEEEMKVKSIYAENLAQFEIEFNQPVALPEKMTAKQVAKYFKITDLKTNKPVDISHARVTYTNRTVLVTANTPVTSEYKFEISNVPNVRQVKQKETFVATRDFTKNTDRMEPDYYFPKMNKSLMTVTFFEPVRPITEKNITFKTVKGSTITNVTILKQTKANEDIVFDFKNAKVNGKSFKGDQLITVQFNGVRDIAGNALPPKPIEASKILFPAFK